MTLNKENIEKNKNVIQIISLIIGIVMVVANLLYNSIVINQQIKNNIELNKTNIERIEKEYSYQINKLENDKVNEELFQMMLDRLERIENKLDNMNNNNSN